MKTIKSLNLHTEVLSRFDRPWLPITALVIFLTCFIIYTYWTFKKENKKLYENTSFMPLHDGVEHDR